MKKTYHFKHETDLDHYTADAFMLRCFDNRFWKAFKRFVRSLKFWHIDPESVAGGAKILATPEKNGDRDFMLREIEKSVKLHHTKRVMLFTHSHCGAYGGLDRFGGSEDKEFKFHQTELKKARSVVEKRFPKLKVETYFINNRGVIRVL